MLRHAEDQVVLFEAGDGLADGAGAEAGVFLDLGDGVWEGFLVSSAALRLVAAQDQQDFEFGAVEVGKMIEDGDRNPYNTELGADWGICMRAVHTDLSALQAWHCKCRIRNESCGLHVQTRAHLLGSLTLKGFDILCQVSNS